MDAFIKQFWAWFVPWTVTSSVDSKVRIRLSGLKGGDAAIEGAGHVVSPMATDFEWKKSYRQAFADLVQRAGTPGK